MTRILSARDFWNLYKNWVWIVVPILGLVLALPALHLIPSDVAVCRERDGIPVSQVEFQNCLTTLRLRHYGYQLMMSGPIMAGVYIIVFFWARAEAAKRGLTLTFGGLADAYFVWLAFLSSLADYIVVFVLSSVSLFVPL